MQTYILIHCFPPSGANAFSFLWENRATEESAWVSENCSAAARSGRSVAAGGAQPKASKGDEEEETGAISICVEIVYIVLLLCDVIMCICISRGAIFAVSERGQEEATGDIYIYIYIYIYIQYVCICIFACVCVCVYMYMYRLRRFLSGSETARPYTGASLLDWPVPCSLAFTR